MHAGDITAALPKTLDFSPLLEFLVGTGFEFCLRGFFRLGSGRRPLTQLEEIADLWLPKCAQVVCRKRGFLFRVRRYQGLELVRG